MTRRLRVLGLALVVLGLLASTVPGWLFLIGALAVVTGIFLMWPNSFRPPWRTACPVLSTISAAWLLLNFAMLVALQVHGSEGALGGAARASIRTAVPWSLGSAIAIWWFSQRRSVNRD
jgi:hypothetical protein